MSFVSDWFERQFEKAQKKHGQIEIAVQQHEVYQLAERQYQIWKIDNGLLLVDTEAGRGDHRNLSYGNAPQADHGLCYYPDLKTMYEALVTREVQRKMGLSTEAKPDYSQGQAAAQAMTTATSGMIKF